MPEEPKRSSEIWTLPNAITLVRICLVPVFVVALLSPWPQWLGIADLINDQVKSLVAAGVFILISCTDWIDGYLARKRNEVTDFGKFMDPLADKILVAAALLALVELQVLPAWPVLIILTREFIVSGVRMLAASKNEIIAASWYGKVKTVAQIAAIVLFLLKDVLIVPGTQGIRDPLYDISWIVMLIALALTIISMLDYISKARHLLGFRSGGEKGDGAAAPTDAQLQRLATEVVAQAERRGVHVGTAESLTGGMISCALTAVPGSSAVVRGGIASYALGVKEQVLGVDAGLLAAQGAVNRDTAIQMACGARGALGADAAVSATGIAGPSGAEPGKPIGTVWVGISVLDEADAVELHLEGDRDTVRRRAAACALELLQEAIVRVPCKDQVGCVQEMR